MASTQVATEYTRWTEGDLQQPTALDEVEYPSLAAEPAQKTSNASMKAPPKSTTTRPRNQRERREAVLSKAESDLLQSCFSGSYVEARKATARRERDSATRRQRALHTLGDKEKLKERLEKTRMCRSVASNVVCPHGESCRFAHSEEELTVPICLFDHDCRYVEFCENGEIKNRGSRPCRQQHTGEDKVQYMRRVGQLSSKPKPLPKPSCTAAPMIPRQLQLNKVPETPVKEQPLEKPVVSEEPETVLVVPIELAPAAMEAAIKAGNRRIRVEIAKQPEVGQYGSDCGRC
jgi:hypothetical protein